MGGRVKSPHARTLAPLDVHLRAPPLTPPTRLPACVQVSTELFHFIHELWMREIPIPELG